MKVYVVMLDKVPHVFSNRGELLRQIEDSKLPFTPDIHECTVIKRVYNKRNDDGHGIG